MEMQSNRQTTVRCGALHKRCEGFRTIAVCFDALQCIAETLRKVCRPLWCFTMHAVQVAHPAVECITIIAVYYGNVMESLQTMGTLVQYCGVLRCIMVHRGNVAEALWTIGMLPNHCGSLRCIAVQVAHVAAECITHSRKRQNSIYFPYHPANPQNP